MSRGVVASIVAALVAAGCAARVPVVTTPVYPEFVFPDVPAGHADAVAARRQREAWAFLQTGDLGGAEQRFTALLATDTQFFPAAAGLGWVDVARGSYGDAVAHFDQALGGQAAYLPALVGRGDALLAADDVDGALDSFEAALRADPGLSRLAGLVGELRLRVMTDRLAEARAASERGRLTEAVAAYARVIDASPDSGFLYLELAQIKRRQGDLEGALADLRRAGALDPNDAAAHVLEGELLEAAGDLGGAEAAYRHADELDPSDDTAARLTRVRAARRLSDLPGEYRAITTREAVTRGELAALLGVRLDELLSEAVIGATTQIFTDTRGHWANQWIVDVTRVGVMGVDARYRFEPERTVRRGDLAEVVADALGLIAEIDPDAERRWVDDRPRFADMNTGHLNYESAALAVAAGVLSVGGDGRFEPTKMVSGSEAVEAVERLARLVREAG